MEFFTTGIKKNTYPASTYTLLLQAQVREEVSSKDRLTYIFCHCLPVLTHSAVAVLLADWKEEGGAEKGRQIDRFFYDFFFLFTVLPGRQTRMSLSDHLSFLPSTSNKPLQSQTSPHAHTNPPTLFVYSLYSCPSFPRLRRTNKLIFATAVTRQQHCTASCITRDNIRGSISSVKPNFAC